MQTQVKARIESRSEPRQLKAVEKLDPKKLLARIRELHAAIGLSTARLRRQKLELWCQTHLYFEAQMTLNSLAASEVAVALAKTVGRTSTYWLHARRYGSFIRDAKIDLECAIPSAVSQVRAPKIDKKHLSVLAEMLNSGVGPSELRRKLRELGYEPITPLPNWKKKEIRAQKKKWSDWLPELAKLAASVRMTTDKQVDLAIQVVVDGKVVCAARAQ